MITKKILYWYDNNKRSLPWRIRCSAKKKEYFTFVSEFMLQQTKVKTVIPYFNNFLKNIPNFQSLAKVSESKLLKHWQGLGYYSRAKNLKKSAKIIINSYSQSLTRSGGVSNVLLPIRLYILSNDSKNPGASGSSSGSNPI